MSPRERLFRAVIADVLPSRDRWVESLWSASGVGSLSAREVGALLAAIDRSARTQFERSFAGCTREQRSSVLQSLRGDAAFETLRATLLVTYADAPSWGMSPGPRNWRGILEVRPRPKWPDLVMTSSKRARSVQRALAERVVLVMADGPIGRSAVRAFLEHGAFVSASAGRPLRDLPQRSARRFFQHRGGVLTAAMRRRWVETTCRLAGRIDALVTIVGDHEACSGVRTAGALVALVAPIMRSAAYGRVVNVSCDGGTRNDTSVAKLDAVTELWSRQLAGTGALVNGMHAGSVRPDDTAADRSRAVTMLLTLLTCEDAGPNGRFFTPWGELAASGAPG